MKPISIISVAVSLAVIAICLCTMFPDRDDSDPEREPFDTATADSLGYKPVRFVKPGQIQPVKPVQGGEAIVAGEGYVVRPDSLEVWPDTLPVELSVLEDGDGNWWAGVWVAGQPVTWQRLEGVKRPDDSPSNWSALIECAWVSERADVGVGAAWTPITLWGTETGLAATVDLNRVIDTAPDWGAVCGHARRLYGPVSVGAEVGYRFGEDAGLHLGVSAGLAIDL